MQDPTREEMRTALAEHAQLVEADEGDIEEAIYWFAADWHGGQASNLYEALCASPYTPSPIASRVEPDTAAEYLYTLLHCIYTRP